MAARQEFVDDRDTSDETQDHHKKNTHGTGAFLQWVGRLDRQVEVDDLGDLYQQWRERRDSGEQSSLTEGWSE